MAGALKQTFLEAVRLTPEGIENFLTTPIPTLAEISQPSDVDSAIIANGVLAYNLNLIFKAFEGLTPVELFLRIGQHNSVLESAMIAGMEYIQGSDSAENGITITAPESGVSYSPGEMKFACAVQNAFATGCTMELDGQSVKMLSVNNSTYQQYVTVTTTGDHSVSMTATFEDGNTQSASVSFSIAEPGEEPPPEPPGGEDRTALDKALSDFNAAYQRLGDFVSYQANVDTLNAQYAIVAQKARLVGGIVSQKNPAGLSEQLGLLETVLENLETAINAELFELNAVVSAMGPLPSIVRRIAGLF